MNVVFLILAILSEVAGTTSLKLSQGFSKPIPSLAVVVFYGLSFTFLSFSLKRLEVGTVYAVWSGVGTALIGTIGILWFKEPLTAMKVGSILLIILGVVGLSLSGPH
jgi:small multidrug resistance pump